jgi:hypothetical protein
MVEPTQALCVLAKAVRLWQSFEFARGAYLNSCIIANALTDRIDVESRPLIWQVGENGLWFLPPECSDVDPSHQRNGDYTARWIAGRDHLFLNTSPRRINP